MLHKLKFYTIDKLLYQIAPISLFLHTQVTSTICLYIFVFHLDGFLKCFLLIRFKCYKYKESFVIYSQ